jgi:hypothetical protein
MSLDVNVSPKRKTHLILIRLLLTTTAFYMQIFIGENLGFQKDSYFPYFRIICFIRIFCVH